MVGLPDYETYARHMQTAHPGQPVMSYEEFFRERQENVSWLVGPLARLSTFPARNRQFLAIIE